MKVDEILNLDSYTDAMWGQKKVKIKYGEDNTILSILSDDFVVIPREHFIQLAKNERVCVSIIRNAFKFRRYLNFVLKYTEQKN